jgi:hypothetical protein
VLCMLHEALPEAAEVYGAATVGDRTTICDSLEQWKSARAVGLATVLPRPAAEAAGWVNGILAWLVAELSDPAVGPDGERLTYYCVVLWTLWAQQQHTPGWFCVKHCYCQCYLNQMHVSDHLCHPRAACSHSSCVRACTFDSTKNAKNARALLCLPGAPDMQPPFDILEDLSFILERTGFCTPHVLLYVTAVLQATQGRDPGTNTRAIIPNGVLPLAGRPERIQVGAVCRLLLPLSVFAVKQALAGSKMSPVPASWCHQVTM